MKKILTSVALASAIFVSSATAADETELTKAVVKLIKQYNGLEARTSTSGGGGYGNCCADMQYEINRLREEVAALRAGGAVAPRSYRDTGASNSEKNLVRGTTDRVRVAPSTKSGRTPVAKTEEEIRAMGAYRSAGTSKKTSAPSYTAPKAKSAKSKPASDAATVYVIQDSKEAGCNTDRCAGDKNADKIIGDFLKDK